MWYISCLWPTTIDRQTSNTTYSSSVAHQYAALLTPPDRNMSPMEAGTAYQGCLPSCKLHSRSLTVVSTGKVRRLRTCVTQSPDCTHVIQSPDCLLNVEIRTQSRDSENAQCNLEIVQVLRLHRTCMYTY